MTITTDYKAVVRQLSIILFVLLALYLALVRPLGQQGVNVIQEQIDETVMQLKTYLSKEQRFLPNKKVKWALEMVVAQNQRNHKLLKEFVDPEKEYLPGDAAESGLYFIEQLHIITKRLRRQANTLRIKIPEHFGFSEEMPADAESVEILLKQLEIVDRVTTLLMEQGVRGISLVKSLTPIEQRDQDTQKLFYQELPVQLSFLSDTSSLVKFLYQIKNFSPLLAVKDVIIKRTDGALLQIEMLLSRLVVS